MRIAIFTDTYLPSRNGASASIDHFSRLLADDGHQIMIFCPKNGHYRDKKYPNISVKRFGSVSTPTYKEWRLSFPFILTVVKELKEFKPDVVHVQTPMPMGVGMMGIWATKILKIKNIQTYHTYLPDFLVYYNPKNLPGIIKLTEFIKSAKLTRKLEKAGISSDNYDSDDIRQHVEKISTEVEAGDKKNKNDKFSERIVRSYTRLVYNSAEIVLTPSPSMKRVLKKQGIESRIEVLSNGIDYDFFKKKSNYSIKYHMVNIGRLGFEKRVDVTIEAFAIALKTNPKLRLDIFGDGPAKQSLLILAKNLGIIKNIKFFGSYDINKVSKQLCNYDCFVTASPIETEGIVILEAMASGLPVLGVNKLGVPDIVKDGKNGYLSRPGDANDMAVNMLKIMESPKVLERFGKKSLEIAKAHEVRICKERLLGFYKQLLK